MTPIRVAMIGDRGIPARYSGFSTLVEQIATRMVRDKEFDVTVYCRKPYFDQRPEHYLGVHCVYLPSPGGKSFESILHSNLSILHAMFQSYDVILVLDPGNGPFVLPLRLLGKPLVMHTDGMGWKRSKWSPIQQKYYKWSEWVTARLAHWLITDSRAMQRYYEEEYSAPSSFIPYAGEIGDRVDNSILAEHKLEDRGYYLCVARVEPENNQLFIIDEYKAAQLEKPLVVVGEARYGTSYGEKVIAAAGNGVHCIGSVYDSAKLNALFGSCYAYLHGHEVGGTNPSLLQAMHMGAAAIPINVVFHREVLSEDATFFEKRPGSLASLLKEVDIDAERIATLRTLSKTRSDALYTWDAVADGYAEVFRRLFQAKKAKLKYNTCFSDEVYRPEQT